jgi:hypothetical protein
MSALDDLQAWYRAQCDGDWEHDVGLNITSLDNPGWLVKINLVGTRLQDEPFVAVEQLDSDERWMVCKVADGRFEGAGDPHRLGDILDRFMAWARSVPDWLAAPNRQTQND